MENVRLTTHHTYTPVLNADQMPTEYTVWDQAKQDAEAAAKRARADAEARVATALAQQEQEVATMRSAHESKLAALRAEKDAELSQLRSELVRHARCCT